MIDFVSNFAQSKIRQNEASQLIFRSLVHFFSSKKRLAETSTGRTKKKAFKRIEFQKPGLSIWTALRLFSDYQESNRSQKNDDIVIAQFWNGKKNAGWERHGKSWADPFRKVWIWIWRFVNTVYMFLIFELPGFDWKKKTEYFLITAIFTIEVFLLEILTKEIKPIVTDN